MGNKWDFTIGVVKSSVNGGEGGGLRPKSCVKLWTPPASKSDSQSCLIKARNVFFGFLGSLNFCFHIDTTSNH